MSGLLQTGGVDPMSLFAALSGPFEPRQALQLGQSDNPGELAMAATRLAEACDTSPAGADGRWLMRTPQRRYVLKSLSPPDLEAAAKARQGPDLDPETRDLIAVLLDQPPLSRADIQAILTGPAGLAEIERVIVALDRAGEAAPGRDLLQPARAALTETTRQQNRRRVAERGFFGRTEEADAIAAWLAAPTLAPPVTCLFLTGGPGIGKSSLLQESVRRLYVRSEPLLLRLDFDRAGLDVLDLHGLTMEAARQIAEELGEAGRALLEERLNAGRMFGSSVREQLSVRQSLPEPLATRLAQAVKESGRALLVVLDTLEVLRGRGETHPGNLFRWLDSLVTRGLAPMSVLAAGRGDALDSCAERVGERRELPGLADDDARLFLDKLGAPKSFWPELLEIAEGNPLKLRLGAEVVRTTGVEKLPRRKRGEKVSAGFLYRFLLSRIEDPDLKKLAHPGLIVRRINADVIQQVLAPRLGLGQISGDRAQHLLNELATQHWLVEPDLGAPGYFKHRSDMRTLLLPLLYRSLPALSARIDAAAMGFFARSPEPWAQVEAVYHQLQLMRRNSRPPAIAAQAAAQFDDQMLSELPPAARDLVLATRGERTSQFRGMPPPGAVGPDHESVAREILAVVQRQDWGEGQYIVRSIVDAGGLDTRSQAADAVRAFLWRSGQWAQARRWLVERDRFDDSDDDVAMMPDTLALARLEMRAEFDPDGLRRRLPALRPMLDGLHSAALSATDNAARFGALAMLLAEGPEPFQFQRGDRRECDIPTAANGLWAGERNEQTDLALELGRERIVRPTIGQPSAPPVPPGRTLATLTPYLAFANNLSVMDGHHELREEAEIAADNLARAGGLLQAEPLPTAPGGGQIGYLSDLGLFAEWAEATAFLRADPDLKLVGRSAERWRRTLAGDWAIGRRPSKWRGLPLVDETLRGRLRELLNTGEPLTAAQAQIEVWAGATEPGGLMPMLRRRLKGALAEAAALARRGAAPDEVLRRLLARGAPAAFAVPLTVLNFWTKP